MCFDISIGLVQISILRLKKILIELVKNYVILPWRQIKLMILFFKNFDNEAYF